MRFTSTRHVRTSWQLSSRRILTTTFEPKPSTLAKTVNLHSWSSSSLNKYLSNLLNISPSSLSSHLHKEAKSLHALLLVTGNLTTLDINGASKPSRLVQLYAHLGNLEHALLVFEKLQPTHDNIACNAIIRAYVDSARFSRALHFFDQLMLLRPGFVPDNYTCPVVLKACSGLCSLEEGRKVYEWIRYAEERRCFKPNVYTKCALIDMFAKCGSLGEARLVFDEMGERERDLVCWTAMICGTIHCGDGIDALRLFKTMRLEGVEPDSVVVASILPACGRLEEKRLGIALQGYCLKCGFGSDLCVSNAVMDMYCKFGETGLAHGVFRRMVCRDVVSWSTLIAGYSQNCEYRRSIELFLEMIDLGVEPSASVVTSVVPVFGKLNLSQQGKTMHGFVLKQGFGFDVVVGSALIDMYSNCGLMSEMEILFDIWSDWDIMIWNSAIAGYVSGGNSGLAFDIFRKMWRSKFRPNSITLVSVLPLCTKMGALKQGMEIHCHAIRTSLALTVSVSNSLIDMYSKCGRLGPGLKVFDQMVEKDIISYNSIISAFGFHGLGKQALAVFEEMKSKAIRPSKVTFVGLLSACSHAGLVDEGFTLYDCMINEYGIRPEMEHYSCMVDLLGRAGRFKDACDFIGKMPDEPDGNVFGSLVAAACRLHNLVDVDSLEVLQDKLGDSGYHVLLSNMYASLKKWKDASRVRALIKDKGLRKKPGNSWLQIGHCTHVFDAGDVTHPEFNRIEEVLDILLSEMKEICILDMVLDNY